MIARVLGGVVLGAALGGCGGDPPTEPGHGAPPPTRRPHPAAAPTPAPAPAPAPAPPPRDAPAAGGRQWASGQAAIDEFQAWYEAHAGEYDAAREFLKEIMERFGGTDYAAAARMRLKEVEGDRERAAGDWFAAAGKAADARLADGDVAGALAVVADVPEKYRGTSFGAQAADWPRHLADKVRSDLSLRAHRADTALAAGDLDGARAEADAARRLGAGARAGFAPQIADTLAKEADALYARVEADIAARERLRRWTAAAGPRLAEGRAQLAAGDAAAAWETAKAIRAQIGPPDPGETGIRRDAEELWIAAATRASDVGAAYAPGVAQKTPLGARLQYDWSDAAQLADWTTATPPARVLAGRLVLPKNALVTHKAHFPHRVQVECQAVPNTVLVCLLGRHVRVVLWIGRRATIHRDATVLADQNLGGRPVRLANPATITITRDGPAVQVTWDGLPAVETVLIDPPAEAELGTVAFFGGPTGAQILRCRLQGDPQLPETATPDIPGAPDTPPPPATPDLPEPPRGSQDLRPRPPGLTGWTPQGHGKWSPRESVEIVFNGGGKRDRLSTLVHELPTRYAFSEYEFGCEMHLVKGRQGSNGGLIFPVGPAHLVWLFDDTDPPELRGAAGVEPRGTLPADSPAWIPVKVRVKDGKATGYLGRGKSWEFTLADTTLATPGRLPQTGVGLVSRGGQAAFRNPAIRFYK